MPTDPGPHDLSKILCILGPDGHTTLKADSPDFFQELNTEFNGFSTGRLAYRSPFGTDYDVVHHTR